MKRRATTLIQIKLIRQREVPRWPVRRWTSRRCRIRSVGDLEGYGWIAVSDEVAPDVHEGFVESRTLIGCGWPYKRGQFCAVFGADDGVLVFVGFVGLVGVCEGVGEPVRWAHER